MALDEKKKNKHPRKMGDRSKRNLLVHVGFAFSLIAISGLSIGFSSWAAGNNEASGSVDGSRGGFNNKDIAVGLVDTILETQTISYDKDSKEVINDGKLGETSYAVYLVTFDYADMVDYGFIDDSGYFYVDLGLEPSLTQSELVFAGLSVTTGTTYVTEGSVHQTHSGTLPLSHRVKIKFVETLSSGSSIRMAEFRYGFTGKVTISSDTPLQFTFSVAPLTLEEVNS